MNTIGSAFAAIAVLMLMIVQIGGLEAATINLVSLQRLYSVNTYDHFYTTSIAEAMQAVGSYGYVSQSVATNVSTNAATGCALIPVYRYWNNKNDHFYTANQSEGNGASGYVSEGIAFYCAANQNECGATEAFYRYYIGSDHLYTTSVDEGFSVVTEGGKFEGVLCYTWP